MGKVDKLEGAMMRNVKAWLDKWGTFMVGRARSKLTRGGGGRDTGRLAASIAHKVTGTADRVQMTVGTNLEYAKFVEGFPKVPRRHFMPFAGHPAFASWAVRRLKLSWSQIAKGPAHGRRASGGRSRGRARTGLPTLTDWKRRKKIKGFLVGGKAWPFLRPALKEMLPRMVKDVERLRCKV